MMLISPGGQQKGKYITPVAPTCLFPQSPVPPVSQSPYSALSMVDVTGTTISGTKCNWRFAGSRWKCFW